MKKVFYLILAGIAIGILMAPGKGSETWEKITDCLDDFKSKAKDSFNDLVDGARNIAKEGKKGAENATNEW
jgi:gas vesicle protein